MTVIKRHLLETLACACLFLTGCVGEGLGDCPENGYGLFFYYPANGTSDVFPAYIDHVGMYVYDTGGERVLSDNFSRSDLQSYQGARLELEAGTYTVVCWGNAAQYTTVEDERILSTGRARQSQYVDGEAVSDFDSLYFGRRTIVIEPSFEKTDTLVFASAHINIEIHIAGYDESGGTRATGQGLIELLNVPVGYDFLMGLTGETSGMYPLWETDEADGSLYSRFRLFRFPDDTEIVINILDPDGSVKATVVLSEFLEKNGITVEGVNEITVPIYILFEGHWVHVTVDGWDTEPVTPVIPGIG